MEAAISPGDTHLNVWGSMPEAEFFTSQGVISTQGFFSTPNGKIFTRSFFPRNYNIKGSIFLNHGYSSHTGWLLQYTAISFAQWGYAAFAADLLGHGRSEGIRSYIPDMQKLADSSLAYFKSVRASKECRNKPAFLWGESMGGALSLLMHLKEPEVFDGAILTAPLISLSVSVTPSWLHYSVYSRLFGLADTWPIPLKSSVVLQSYRDEERGKLRAFDGLRYSGQVRVGTYRELLWVVDYLHKNFDNIRLPFLTLHGTADSITDPRGSAELVEKAKSEDKTAKFYDGSYHSLVQGEPEETRNRVLADMKEWLEERVQRLTEKYANKVSDN